MSIKATRISDQRLGWHGEEFGEARLGVEKITDDYKEVGLWFDTTQSIYRILISGDSFKDIALKMMEADPRQAIKAFGAALQTGLPEAPSP